MVPHPIPFTEPAEGWWRWNSCHANSKQLKDLLKGDKLIGLAALDVQIKYPQFQKYKPENFSKNLSRVKLELGLGEAAAGSDGAPVIATAVPSTDSTTPDLTKMASKPIVMVSPFKFVDSADLPEGVMEKRLPGSLENGLTASISVIPLKFIYFLGCPLVGLLTRAQFFSVGCSCLVISPTLQRLLASLNCQMAANAIQASMFALLLANN